jgi:hypothetical protein
MDPPILSYSVREGKIQHKKLSKTDHDTAMIKPPSEQHNNPRLDPLIPSILT